MSGPTTVEVGQAATFTAAISATYLGSSQQAQGTVDFSANFTDLCAGVGVQAASSTQASCTTTFTQTGTEYLFATFSDGVGDSSSQAELTVDVVNQVPTTTSVTPSTTTPVVGQPVTYTATVSDATGALPTGSVTFTNGSMALCSAVALSSSAPYNASCSTVYDAPSAGQTVTATYSGGTTTLGSHGQSMVPVGQAATATVLSPSPGTPVFGQAVSLTAQVKAAAPSTNGPAPTGLVTFTVDGQQVRAPVALAGGDATSTPIANLTPGVHQVAATYAGDTNYTGSSTSSSLSVGCTTTITTSYSGAFTVKAGTCVEGGTIIGPVNFAPGGTLAVIGGGITGR